MNRSILLSLCLLLTLLATVGFLPAQIQCLDYDYGKATVNALLQSGDSLYLATDVGFFVVNTATNSKQHYHIGNSGFKAGKALTLAKQNNGTVWIGGENGLYSYANGVVTKFVHNQVDREIISLYIDANNYIWFGIGYSGATHLGRIDPGGHYSSYAFLSAPMAICEVNGYLWCGYEDELKVVRLETANIVTYTTANSALLDNDIRDIKSDNLGNIWICTATGLTKVEPNTQWTSYDNSILADGYQIDLDAQNRVWIAKTSEVVCFFIDNLEQYNYYLLGLQAGNIRSVYCGDGIWFGALGYYGSKYGDVYSAYQLWTEDLLNFPIYSVHSYGSDRLWISYGYNESFDLSDLYSVVEGEINHYYMPNDLDERIRFAGGINRHLYAMTYSSLYKIVNNQWTLLTSSGNMSHYCSKGNKTYFTSDYEGIIIAEGDSFRFIPTANTYWPQNDPRCLAVDEMDRVWTTNGVLMSIADTLQTLYPDYPTASYPSCVAAPVTGDVWIGFQNGRIYSFDGTDFTFITAIPLDEDIWSMVFGANGEVWIRGQENLYLWHNSCGLVTVLPYNNYSSLLRSISPGAQNSLIAAAENGYFWLSFTPPSSVSEHTEPVPLVTNPLLVYPNPCPENLTIALKEGQASSAIQIYNLKGQLLRTIGWNGQSSQIWDGKDAHGTKVSSGIYLVCTKIGGKNIATKALILK